MNALDFHLTLVASSCKHAAELIGCARNTPSEDYHTMHVVGAIRWLKAARINLALAEFELLPARARSLKPLRLRRGKQGGRA